jgi:amino acid transporter
VNAPRPQPPEEAGGLQRHFGLLQATALNVTMIVGTGVFVTIPLMLGKLPGPYALLGWLAGGGLMLADGLVWSELAAALPGSGGSYLYLLEAYGRERWGRLMAFLFIWQFLLSGPLEVATGFISIAQLSDALDPGFASWNAAWTRQLVLGRWAGKDLVVFLGPAQFASAALGLVCVALLYRRITGLGKLTVTFWLGVLGVLGWILADGWWRFDPGVAFKPPEPGPGHQPGSAAEWALALGGTTILAMYSYLGYYHVCYIGDEVRDPRRTIPRAVLLSAVLVCVLFAGLHLALLGTVPWGEVQGTKNLPAEFMQKVHGPWAARLVTLLMIWSSFGSGFAALLGYSRIPYGAARYGHFFAVLGRVHPVHRIPHVSLLLVGGLTFFWSFFDLGDVISALITTRILGQFIAQVFGVALLRRQPGRARPYRMWLYPLPCGLALAGWLYLYLSSGTPFIVLGLVVLGLGLLAFSARAWQTRGWPFQ